MQGALIARILFVKLILPAAGYWLQGERSNLKDYRKYPQLSGRQRRTSLVGIAHSLFPVLT
jgi:hypothetical protein